MGVRATLLGGGDARGAFGAPPVEHPIRIGVVGLGNRAMAMIGQPLYVEGEYWRVRLYHGP